MDITKREIIIAAILIFPYVIQWYIRRRRRKTALSRQQNSEFSLGKSVSFASLEQELASFNALESPYSTGLFPSDLHLLMLHGYAPLQIVTGNVSYSMGFKGVTSSVMRAMRQGEMPAVTRMLNDARLIARNRLVAQAQSIGADGVIGVVFQTNDVLDFVEVTAMGTAVKKVGEDRSSTEAPALDVAIN